jgi:hypothetical protein
MKLKNYIILLCCGGLFSCEKIIDLHSESNLSTGTYYSNLAEVKSGLTGAYNGMQATLYNEWQFTELRSDNSKMGVTGSTATANREFSDLDMFIPSTSQQQIFNYWRANYNNIRNCNIIINRLGAEYDPATGTITFKDISIPISETDRKQLAGEAMFIRAYHYFNMVRLFGGVFLIHKQVSPLESLTINRSSAADIYKLIEADLQTGASSMNGLTFSQIAAADKGRATRWAAKGLLAKVYLTLNRKAEAITLLQDVITNSGYGLQGTYANVFSITNEMNSEILFAVRYKAGGLGLGSSFGNDFAPLGTGSTIINGDGDGWNFPTAELDTLTNGDLRKPTILASNGSGASMRLYVKKYLFPVILANDGESDWPILRYADILLMMAEAKGYTQESIDLINSVRPRAGLPDYTLASLPDIASFEKALSQERRVEFAFENQRWFDLLRFGTTLTTINAIQRIRDHYADEYVAHYSTYLPPTPTLAQLQAFITTEKLLLPIPQREIDTNTQLDIPQNPGY